MKRKVIVNIYDDTLTMGGAFSLLNGIDYNHKYFERDYLIETSQHLVYFKLNKTHLRVDISKNKRGKDE